MKTKIIIIHTNDLVTKAKILRFFLNKGVVIDVDSNTNILFYNQEDNKISDMCNLYKYSEYLNLMTKTKWHIEKEMIHGIDYDEEELSMLIESNKLNLL